MVFGPASDWFGKDLDLVDINVNSLEGTEFGSGRIVLDCTLTNDVEAGDVKISTSTGKVRLNTTIASLPLLVEAWNLAAKTTHHVCAKNRTRKMPVSMRERSVVALRVPMPSDPSLRVTAMATRHGWITIMGCRTQTEINDAVQTIVSTMETIRRKTRNQLVRTLNNDQPVFVQIPLDIYFYKAEADLGFAIHPFAAISFLAMSLRIKNITYNPDKDSAIQVRTRGDDACVRIFASGRLMVSSNRDRSKLVRAVAAVKSSLVPARLGIENEAGRKPVRGKSKHRQN